MSDELRLRRSNLTWRVIDGQIVSLDAATSRYLSANRAGAILWRALADGSDRGTLVALLEDAFELDQETASRDVEAFLGELAAEGLLEQPP